MPLKVKFKRYRLLDGSKRSMVQRVSRGDIIRRFEKTSYPEKADDVVCPHFLELAWSWGCPYDCSWCYLKGTYRFFLDKKTGRVLPHFKNRDRIRRVCMSFIKSESQPLKSEPACTKICYNI